MLCFVDFLSPAHAATAMDALQGEYVEGFLGCVQILYINILTFDPCALLCACAMFVDTLESCGEPLQGNFVYEQTNLLCADRTVHLYAFPEVRESGLPLFMEIEILKIMIALLLLLLLSIVWKQMPLTGFGVWAGCGRDQNAENGVRINLD